MGLNRLKATLARSTERGAASVIENLARAIGEFQTGEPADDTAVLVLSRRARSATSLAVGESRVAAAREAADSRRYPDTTPSAVRRGSGGSANEV